LDRCKCVVNKPIKNPSNKHRKRLPDLDSITPRAILRLVPWVSRQNEMSVCGCKTETDNIYSNHGAVWVKSIKSQGQA